MGAHAVALRAGQKSSAPVSRVLFPRLREVAEAFGPDLQDSGGDAVTSSSYNGKAFCLSSPMTAWIFP
jgi:hypothetical protein